MKNDIEMSEFDRPTVIIRLNKLYSPQITAKELYDITRCYWRSSKLKAQQCDLALSVYRGTVLEVYEIDSWVDGALIRLTTSLNSYRADSFGFNGHVASQELRRKYIGRSVAHFFRRGDQSPVRAFNVV